MPFISSELADSPIISDFKSNIKMDKSNRVRVEKQLETGSVFRTYVDSTPLSYIRTGYIWPLESSTLK